MTASRTKDEALLPLGMKGRLIQKFDFRYKTIRVVRMRASEGVSNRVWYNIR